MIPLMKYWNIRTPLSCCSYLTSTNEHDEDIGALDNKKLHDILYIYGTEEIKQLWYNHPHHQKQNILSTSLTDTNWMFSLRMIYTH